MADHDTKSLVPSSKRQRTDAASSSTAPSREREGLTLELNPLYLKTLRDRSELGYRRPVGQEKLPLITYEIDIPVLQDAMSAVLTKALALRYFAESDLDPSEIDVEIQELVALVVDACMSALYSKLRNIHRSYGRHSSRYGPPSAYTEEIEIPLPFAQAIQEFGAFETHSLEANFVIAPTYAEGVQNEGRKTPLFNHTEFQSRVRTLKNLGIPCMSVDSGIKAGSAWWTYYAQTKFGTHDLVCTLPFSHYPDESAVLRSVFLFPGNSGKVENFIKFPVDVRNYGTGMREMRSVNAVNSFMALCHRPEEEWSRGPI